MASDDEADHVTRLIETYHVLFSAGDVEGVLDLWDDDGSVFEPGSPTARGKSQIRSAYERGYAGANYDFQFKGADVGAAPRAASPSRPPVTACRPELARCLRPGGSTARPMEALALHVPGGSIGLR